MSLSSIKFTQHLVENYGNAPIEEAELIFIGEQDHTDIYREVIESLIINILHDKHNIIIIEGFKKNISPENADYKKNLLIKSLKHINTTIVGPEKRSTTKRIIEIYADLYKTMNEIESTNAKICELKSQRKQNKNLKRKQLLNQELKNNEKILRNDLKKCKKLLSIKNKFVIKKRNSELKKCIYKQMKNKSKSTKLFVIFGDNHYDKQFLSNFDTFKYRVFVPKVFQTYGSKEYGMKLLKDAATSNI